MNLHEYLLYKNRTSNWEGDGCCWFLPLVFDCRCCKIVVVEFAACIVKMLLLRSKIHHSFSDQFQIRLPSAVYDSWCQFRVNRPTISTNLWNDFNVGPNVSKSNSYEIRYVWKCIRCEPKYYALKSSSGPGGKCSRWRQDLKTRFWGRLRRQKSHIPSA